MHPACVTALLALSAPAGAARAAVSSPDWPLIVVTLLAPVLVALVQQVFACRRETHVASRRRSVASATSTTARQPVSWWGYGPPDA